MLSASIPKFPKLSQPHLLWVASCIITTLSDHPCNTHLLHMLTRALYQCGDISASSSTTCTNQKSVLQLLANQKSPWTAPPPSISRHGARARRSKYPWNEIWAWQKWKTKNKPWLLFNMDLFNSMTELELFSNFLHLVSLKYASLLSVFLLSTTLAPPPTSILISRTMFQWGLFFSKS